MKANKFVLVYCNLIPYWKKTNDIGKVMENYDIEKMDGTFFRLLQLKSLLKENNDNGK